MGLSLGRNFPRRVCASLRNAKQGSTCMRCDCRPCRPKHAGRVLWANAQTCKKSIAFENGPEARETPEERSSARTRAKIDGVYTIQFLISVVNNLG